jgi:hypothetical protein
MQRASSFPSLVAAIALAALGVAAGTTPAEARGSKPSPRGRDKSAPTLVVPADITVDAIAPMGRVVRWSVTATDDKDPAPVVVSSRTSGSVFPVGTTTVTVTATDSAGHATTDTFDVTVQPMAGPTVYKEYWVDVDGYAWFEWDITVSPDGTVSGSGRQTMPIEVYADIYYWYGGDLSAVVLWTPSDLAGTGVVSGTIAPDGSCQIVSSRNYWYTNSGDVDESGNPIFREDTGGFSGSMTASLAGDNLVFSGSPLDAPDLVDFYGYANRWIRQ